MIDIYAYTSSLNMEQLALDSCSVCTNLLGLTGLCYGVLRQALLNQNANCLGKTLKVRVIYLCLDAFLCNSKGNIITQHHLKPIIL